MQILPRRDPAAAWVSNNPVLGVGEMGYETDTKRFKRGDGSTPWNTLPYADTAACIADATTLGRAVLTAATTDDALAALAAEPALPAGGT